MSRFGYDGDLSCCLCADAQETATHLFFECTYSSICVQLVADHLGVCIPNTGTWNWWEMSRFKSMLHKKMIGVAIVALVYYIWKAKNHSLHNAILVRPDIWIKSLVSDLFYRCKSQISDCVRVRHDAWLSNL
ncbi:hypothetical protein RND81_09G087900 [Saponaria officinalis]|uniref:Reverse transcriptase zinc-binding domain-containing protein n=1 Tax=Saponaria officinalis TaxID=3572 RepID=A0AAW1IKJ4_SAPOF